ncbi:MAG: trigger factor [Actinomycetota bacterium]|nr:trigger factor [Actinomycetota bacterium]
MATAIRTTVTELPESRVRVQAELDAAELQRSVERTARKIGSELKIPGFRKGKVPPPVVIQRIGRETILDETVQTGLTDWYLRAVENAGIRPVGDPDVKMGAMPGEGEPLRFSVEVGVRPKATLGEYRGLEVGRREPQAPEEDVEKELESMRERLARLEAVDRAAGDGDFVLVDFVGYIDGEPFAGGEGRDQVIELGANRFIPGFEEALDGAEAGDEVTVDLTFPESYPKPELAGRPAQFEVSVKEVKVREMPELDDDLAVELGYDTLEEAREDIANRLREEDAARIQEEFREAAIDAAVRQAQIKVPRPLVEARAQELWQRLLHDLGHQQISKETYLKLADKTEEQALAEARPEAEQALKREAVIAAIVEAEGIDPAPAELMEALEPIAERNDTTVKKLHDRLRSSGQLSDMYEQLAAKRAIDLVAETAVPVSVEQAEAREKIWTPDPKVSEAKTDKQLWTPGS